MLSISTYLGKQFWSLVFLTIGSPLIRFIFCSFCPAFAPAPPSLCMAPQVPALCWVSPAHRGTWVATCVWATAAAFCHPLSDEQRKHWKSSALCCVSKTPLCQDWFPLAWGEQTYERNKSNQFAIAWKPGQRPKRPSVFLPTPLAVRIHWWDSFIWSWEERETEGRSSKRKLELLGRSCVLHPCSNASCWGCFRLPNLLCCLGSGAAQSDPFRQFGQWCC